MGFNKDFLWGAATASYQIEGGAFEDGKGLNIWDVFSHDKERTFNGHTGDIACDHYHRIEEDVALMKEIGLKAYRFSVSWARILPDGTGKINQKGIDFYNKLIDELIKNDIEPCLTVFHWDLPYELSKKGGWLNEEAPLWFESYTKIIAENFSDRVKYFFTVNEPECFVGHGYCTGLHAPGIKLSKKELLQTVHNVLLAHGRSVKALREFSKQPVKIGFVPCGSFNFPASDSADDIEATRKSYVALHKDWLTFDFALWIDPVVFGKYPEQYLAEYKDILPAITDEDMKIISQPIDFLGLNIYFGNKIKAGDNNEPEIVPFEQGYPMSALSWNIVPETMYWGTKFMYERYKLPIIISENGLSCRDSISVDSKVHDPQRTDFLTRYLKELKRSAEDGTEILGYFHWSLMDNFEWAEGYKDRFGLIYVDYSSQKRIIKDSAYFYKDVINSNGEIL